jgi:signal transduction histidine kinase
MNLDPNNPVYVLLVDDLEENLISLEALLRQDGLIILKAKSGKDALELLLTHEVALALMDVQMPGMDGFELAELMRGAERTRSIPIIFLTAGSADWLKRFRGYEAGAVDFLQKPVESDILRSKVRVFLDLYRQRQIVAQQRDELEKSADALKLADQRKDVFLATLAHELRNPLAPIRNGLQVIRMTDNEKVIAQVEDMMERQINHMVRLIDDLLDVSRISQGKIVLRKEKIKLSDILESAIEGSRPLIERSKHKLSVSVPDEELWFYADLTRAAQIIGNLLNNAAKYTNEGGDIRLEVKADEAQAYISVTDNGLGLRADMLPRVFDLFTQVDNNLVRSQGGLGIGLALVRELIQMHGGSISATSEGLGHGSTFTAVLPLTEPVEAPVKGYDEAEAGQDVPSLQVMVVDDNVDSAKTIAWMLEMMGHSPSLVHSGAEAIDMARATVPDAILLDIGLPGISGYDGCRTLRADPVFKDTLMIAQTGWGQARDRAQAKDAGFDHHMTKPISFDQLSALLTTERAA